MRDVVDALPAERRGEIDEPRSLHEARAHVAAVGEVPARRTVVGELPENRVEQALARRDRPEARPREVRLLEVVEPVSRVADEHVGEARRGSEPRDGRDTRVRHGPPLSVVRLRDEVRIVDLRRDGQLDHRVEQGEARAVHEHVGALEQVERPAPIRRVEADRPGRRRLQAGDERLRLARIDVRDDELRDLRAGSEIGRDGASHLSRSAEHDDAHDERPRISRSKAPGFQPNPC